MSVSSVISIRDQGALDLVRSLLEQGISVRIRVSGASMRPLLNSGEIIGDISCTPAAENQGDFFL